MSSSAAKSGQTLPASRARATLSRAFSPMLYESASVDSGNPTNSVSRSSRATALSFLDEFPSVVDALPLSYRESLRGPLKRLYNLSNKAGDVSSLLHRLGVHKVDGTWPSQLLGVHLPSLQVSKEYLEAAPNATQGLSVAHDIYRKEALSNLITIKETELAWIESQLEPQVFLATFSTIIDGIYHNLSVKWKIPKFVTNDNNEMSVTAWEDSSILQEEHDRLLYDVVHFGIRVIEISRTITQLRAHKIKSKEKVKEISEVEMGDDTATTASMRKLVAEEFKKLATKSTPPTAGPSKEKGKGKKSQSSASRQTRENANARKKGNLPTPRGKRPPSAPQKGKGKGKQT
ncbi:hypothetical protein JAAARDRAFT_188445 [Jaapia argillacea MUCL 33604]|uniref:Uncharacterized protein n=1 Tax=Jaapia argillacea MUCL 33604 TaxID=933084 RepID=A0A067QR55_9AGAM|nr:hypothetical protein JAAARDRAFT_188445 [Jaapia argillacea MUCL 33604]